MKKKTFYLVRSVMLFGALVFVVGCAQKTNNTNQEVQNGNSNTVVNESTNASQDANQNTNTATEEVIDTSDWQTYMNEEYGFSFKYPKEYTNWEAKVSEEVQASRQDGLLFDIGVGPEDLQGSVLIVKVFNRPLQDILNVMNESEIGKVTGEKILIDDKEGIVLSGELVRVAIEQEGYTYVFTTHNYYFDQDKELKNIVHHILQTVQFS